MVADFASRLTSTPFLGAGPGVWEGVGEGGTQPFDPSGQVGSDMAGAVSPVSRRWMWALVCYAKVGAASVLCWLAPGQGDYLKLVSSGGRKGTKIP